MPKEYLHWCVAETALGLLPDGSVERRFAPAAALGANLPDLPFYYLGGPDAGDFKRTSREIHGEEGTDTFAPVRAGWSAIGALSDSGFVPETGWRRALLFGYLSHMAADTVFHPLVFHYSGDDLKEHFRFESVLDLYYMQRRSTSFGGRAGRLLARIPATRAELTEFLGTVIFAGRPYDTKALRGCVDRFLILQRLFYNPVVAALVKAAGAFLDSARLYAMSFYRSEFRRQAGAFDRPLHFRHPVTGREQTSRVEDLEREAAALTVEWFDLLSNGRNLPASPNLSTGLPLGGEQHMRYFAAAGVEGLLTPPRG